MKSEKGEARQTEESPAQQPMEIIEQEIKPLECFLRLAQLAAKETLSEDEHFDYVSMLTFAHSIAEKYLERAELSEALPSQSDDILNRLIEKQRLEFVRLREVFAAIVRWCDGQNPPGECLTRIEELATAETAKDWSHERWQKLEAESPPSQLERSARFSELDWDVLEQAADYLNQLGGGPMEDRLRLLAENVRSELGEAEAPLHPSRTRQDILRDLEKPDLTNEQCGDLYRELHSAGVVPVPERIANRAGKSNRPQERAIAAECQCEPPKSADEEGYECPVHPREAQHPEPAPKGKA